MAINSKKTAYALFALSEEGYDPSKIAEVFWGYAVSSNVLYIVPNVIRHLELLNERKKKEKTLSIQAPYPLSEDVQEQIRRLMKAPEGSSAEISLDKSLIGGFTARYDNAIYDASIKNQLETLKKELISN